MQDATEPNSKPKAFFQSLAENKIMFSIFRLTTKAKLPLFNKNVFFTVFALQFFDSLSLLIWVTWNSHVLTAVNLVWVLWDGAELKKKINNPKVFFTNYFVNFKPKPETVKLAFPYFVIFLLHTQLSK